MIFGICILVWFSKSYVLYDLLYIYIFNLLLRNYWIYGWCMVLMIRLYGDKKVGREIVFSILWCMA